MGKQGKFLSIILIISIILTNIGQTKTVFAEEDIKENTVAKETYVFNPEDWDIKKNGNEWQLTGYKGKSGNNIIYVPAVYEDNGSEIDIAIPNLNILKGKAKEIVIKEVDGKKVKVTETRGAFNSDEQLEKIDLSGLDTSSVSDMSYMFCNCSKLEKIDLSGMNTENLEKAQDMFSYCASLKSLDLSVLNTPKLKNIPSMFHACINLEELSLNSFNKENGLQLLPLSSLIKLKTLRLPPELLDVDILLKDSNIEEIYLKVDGNSGEGLGKNFFKRSFVEDYHERVRLLLELYYAYKGDESIDMLKELGCLEGEDINNNLSKNEFVDAVYRNVDIDNYDVVQKVFEIIDRVFKKVDGEDGIARLSNYSTLGIALKEVQYAKTGFPLLVTTNNKEYFEGYDFQSDNRIPMELGPMLGTGEQSFKTGEQVRYIYKNDRIVYGEGELENLKITKEMLDELIKDVDLEGNDGKKIRIKGVLDGDKSISLDDLVGRSILDEKDKTYILEYEEVPEEVSYRVNFIVDGRDNIVEVKEGSKVLSTDLPSTEKPGYDFVEWNSKEDGSGDVFDISKPVEKDMVFYAIYKEKPVEKPEEKPVVKPEVSYRVNFIVDGRDNIVKVKEGSRVLSTSIPSIEKPGYDFVEWNSKEDGSGDVFDISKPVEKNMVFYAIYKEKPVEKPEEKPVVKPEVSYRVNFIVDGKDNIVKVKEGSRVLSTSIPPTEKPGYDFVEWNSKEDGSGDVFDILKPVEKDMVFYAIYKSKPVEKPEEKPVVKPEVSYRVNFIVDDKDNIVEVKEGSRVLSTSIPPTEKPGYDFVEWNSKEDGSGDVFDISEPVEKDMVFYAIYKSKPVEQVEFDHLAYLKGYEDNTIRPLGQLTREETAMIFYRILDKKDINKNRKLSKRFPDVKRGSWSEEAIESLASLGILEGYEDGNFRPKDRITRGELATILAKISSMERVSTRFTDLKGHWAKAYIESIEAKGWIEGYKDGSFKPDVNIKRSELARMVNKYLGRYVDKEKVLAGVREFKDFNKLSDKKWYYKDLVEASNNHRGLTDNEIYTWKEIF